MSIKVEAIRELLKHEHQCRIENNERDYSYFHPSEFYQCIRKIAYKYYGIEGKNTIKPDLQRIFDNGKHMHIRYTEYFDNIGILYGVWECKNPLCKETYGKEEKYGILKPSVNCDKCGCKEYLYVEVEKENVEQMVSGHVDGIIKVGGEFCVIDYKSMHSNQFTRLKEPLDKHIIQVEIYLWLLGMKSGFLLYENKDSQKIKLFEVVYNDNLIEKILNRLKALREIVDNKKIPKRPFEKDSTQCRACEFCATCWEKSSKKIK